MEKGEIFEFLDITETEVRFQLRHKFDIAESRKREVTSSRIVFTFSKFLKNSDIFNSFPPVTSFQNDLF